MSARRDLSHDVCAAGKCCMTFTSWLLLVAICMNVGMIDSNYIQRS